MSNILEGRVWETIKLPPLEMFLLVAIADTTHDHGAGYWASDEFLHWKTNLSCSFIEKTKRKFREAGVLVPVGYINLWTDERRRCDVSVERGVGGRGWAVIYELDLSQLPTKEPWRGHNWRQKKVVPQTTFPQKGRTPGGTKVVPQAAKGRTTGGRNKEELSEELSGQLSGGTHPPLSPVELVAREKLAEHIKRGPDPRDPDYDHKLFRHILAGRGGLTPTQVKDFLGEDPQWRKWKYWELLDSQEEISFPAEPQQPSTGNHINYPVDFVRDRFWAAILAKLERKISEHSYETWLKPTRGDGLYDGVLYVRIPTPEFKHIEEKFGDQIQEALPAEVKAVRFVTIEDLLAEFGEKTEAQTTAQTTVNSV